jgi:hypothetical protein
MGILAGKKTYVVGVMALIGFAASYLTGDITLAQAMQGALTAVLGMTLRSGITSDTK